MRVHILRSFDEQASGGSDSLWVLRLEMPFEILLIQLATKLSLVAVGSTECLLVATDLECSQEDLAPHVDSVRVPKS
jgi:hypothetical protein